MPAKTAEALGKADSFLKVQEQISIVAQINRPVLIIGERGTGKELAASRLHYLSKRWQHPFVTLNCAALNPSVLESELFGHEAGAFTGAVRLRKGRFEMAQEGTLFLDEIGNMPQIIQEKILRVIEYGTFERVGGSTPVDVDVRIVAATNADLPVLVKKGTFKADLLDRLSFEVVVLPPLRTRSEDIPLLTRYFAAQMSCELNRETPRFTDSALCKLTKYHWPGNIRELKNTVDRAVYRNTGEAIDTITINPFDYEEANDGATTGNFVLETPSLTRNNSITDAVTLPRLQGSLPETLDALERQYLSLALEQCRFNQRKAAVFLGISYHQFRGLYRKHAAAFMEQMI